MEGFGEPIAQVIAEIFAARHNQLGANMQSPRLLLVYQQLQRRWVAAEHGGLKVVELLYNLRQGV